MKSITAIQDLFLSRILVYRIASSLSPIRYKRSKAIKLLEQLLLEKI